MMRYNLYELMGSKTGFKPSKDYVLTFQDKKEHDAFEDTANKVGEQLLKQAYPLLDDGNLCYYLALRFVKNEPIFIVHSFSVKYAEIYYYL